MSETLKGIVLFTMQNTWQI